MTREQKIEASITNAIRDNVTGVKPDGANYRLLAKELNELELRSVVSNLLGIYPQSQRVAFKIYGDKVYRTANGYREI